MRYTTGTSLLSILLMICLYLFLLYLWSVNDGHSRCQDSSWRGVRECWPLDDAVQSAVFPPNDARISNLFLALFIFSSSLIDLIFLSVYFLGRGGVYEMESNNHKGNYSIGSGAGCCVTRSPWRFITCCPVIAFINSFFFVVVFHLSVVSLLILSDVIAVGPNWKSWWYSYRFCVVFNFELFGRCLLWYKTNWNGLYQWWSGRHFFLFISYFYMQWLHE